MRFFSICTLPASGSGQWFQCSKMWLAYKCGWVTSLMADGILTKIREASQLRRVISLVMLIMVTIQ